MAIFFYLPFILWKYFTNKDIINVQFIIENCLKHEGCVSIEKTAKILYSLINFKQIPNKSKFFYANLCIKYILVKLLYATNAICQFLLLGWILDMNFIKIAYYHSDITSLSLYDKLRIMMALIYNSFSGQSQIFPIQTMCDLSTFDIGKNIHNYTFQCLLLINLFNQKIFTFLYLLFFL